MHALCPPSALPTLLSGSGPFFPSKSLLVSLSSLFLSLFFILVSVICHQVYWRSLHVGLVSCLLLLCPSFTLPQSQVPKSDQTEYPIPSLEAFTGSLSYGQWQGSASFFLKGLGSKHFRLCEPNQRYYIRTYITT